MSERATWRALTRDRPALLNHTTGSTVLARIVRRHTAGSKVRCRIMKARGLSTRSSSGAFSITATISPRASSRHKVRWLVWCLAIVLVRLANRPPQLASGSSYGFNVITHAMV